LPTIPQSSYQVTVWEVCLGTLLAALLMLVIVGNTLDS
jgi:hypothetical protein